MSKNVSGKKSRDLHASLQGKPVERQSGQQDVLQFVHLRLHSAYSLLEGAIRLKELPGLVRDGGMPAVGITDTGNLFGALEASETLSKDGIQPITGCTLAIDLGLDDDGPGLGRNEHKDPDGSLAFLVQNEQGYTNLMKLTSKAYLETEGTDDPHISIEDLDARSEGLICLTDRKSTRLNSSHDQISYAVFCLKKKKKEKIKCQEV